VSIGAILLTFRLVGADGSDLSAFDFQRAAAASFAMALRCSVVSLRARAWFLAPFQELNSPLPAMFDAAGRHALSRAHLRGQKPAVECSIPGNAHTCKRGSGKDPLVVMPKSGSANVPNARMLRDVLT